MIKGWDEHGLDRRPLPPGRWASSASRHERRPVMGDKSAIEWTDATWNPVTGCTKVTRGCDNCYAERLAERFRGTPGHPFERGFDLTLRPERLSQPLSWKRPRKIFVNSMSDLFHKEIPAEFVDRVFDVMEEADRHVFQILTKRSSLMESYLKRRYEWSNAPRHIWCGVSVEDHMATARIRHLRRAPVAVRFLSIEPLLGPVGDIDLEGISWVIVGGESGPGRARCRSAGLSTSGISVNEPVSTSSSSNGADLRRNRAGDDSREPSTMRYPFG